MEDLCDRCRSLDLQAALGQLQTGPPDSAPAEIDLSAKSHPNNEWYGKLRDIGSSSLHCALCALIMKGWRASRVAMIEENIKSAQVNSDNLPADFAKDILEIDCYGDDDATVRLELSSRQNDGDDGRGHRKATFLKVTCSPRSISSFESNYPLVAEFRVFIDNENKTSMGIDIAIHPDPLSASVLGISSAWLSNCISNHQDTCGQQARGDILDWPGLPSRILDVKLLESADTIYLQSRDLISSSDRRYVALSHCWGKMEHPFCTTKDTLNDRMNGINVSAMPRTFQNAVIIVRSLGLRYLWIDSLCIIQGDEEDWAKEAADMSNIYRYCHLLIGAARGASDEAGFLQMRSQIDVAKLERHASESNSSFQPSKAENIHLQLLPPEASRWTYDSHVDPMSGEPLNGRAWCLQGRLLPTRALFYGSTQMFWECQKLRASEDGNIATHSGILLEQLCSTGESSTSVFLRFAEGSDGDTEEDIRGNKWIAWYNMVEEYSTRSLTKDDDRLVALGGLARIIAKSTSATYLAGLWETGLIEGLMWSRKSRDQQLRTPSAYSAPSWSWASVVGPVRFLMYTWYDRAIWKAGYSDFEALAECIEYQVEPKKLEDQYGRLNQGRLTLRAPLLSITALRPQQESSVDTHQYADMVPYRSPVTDKVFHLRHGRKSMWIEGGFDKFADADLPLSQVFAVFLTRLPNVGSTDKVFGRYRFLEHRFGLIVRKTQEGEYRRIGFIDGFILRRRLYGLPAMLSRGEVEREFENTSYVCSASQEEFELYEPESKCAPDPLKIKPENVVLV
ncbi:HET-domain-containing protein [Xylariaceae sp. FL1651]|nr:HET-domain-containing protein [Xylariaceae sp. FL1651]